MEQLLATKFFVPSIRAELVSRPRLIERLNEGLHSKLILVSAPAGFGKTTLVSEWIASSKRKVAWLSLDERDNDPTRFLIYFIAALQSIVANVGKGALGLLQAPQPPPGEAILTALINDITTVPEDFIFVLDDYHLIESQIIDNALIFMLEHLPPQMHLLIASRIDPSFPYSRLRAGSQMIEIREDDLRFSAEETNTFLDRVMGLELSTDNVTALEARTEGWIAGLQLAALSMQGLKRSEEIADFVNRFTGSDRYIQDYLADEVLRQQPKSRIDFLLQTSILNRLSGPLCDAIRFAGDNESSIPEGEKSQAMLEALEAANLFIVPLDYERRWYRYHYLFADLLRQRLQQQQPDRVAEFHIRASEWYEKNGLEVEALQHAAAANDIERAARLVEGEGMPLQFRGAVFPVLNWLRSLPRTVLDDRPSLWVMYASALSMTGQLTGVEEKLQAAEAALEGAEPDDKTRNLIGHIAAIRALLAAVDRQVDVIISQSQRALEYLDPNNLSVRTATIWKLGIAYQLQGDRQAASQAYGEAISISQASGNIIICMSAMIGLGQVQETENQLYQAAETYRGVLQMAGDQPKLAACEAHLGLAQIYYEWNDMDAALKQAEFCTQLARQLENIDRLVASQVFLARLKLAQGDEPGAAEIAAQADRSVRQHKLVFQAPELAAVQALAALREGNLEAATVLAKTYELPILQARLHLAKGDASTALESLRAYRQQMETKGWVDERLKAMVLEAVALQSLGETGKAIPLFGEALRLAEPGGFIRIFLDEGIPMARLLSEAVGRGVMPDYARKLLAAFEAEQQMTGDKSSFLSPQPLIEALSQREIEILRLIAQGLSNREIGERLFLALNTVKGYNRKIFGKLQVQRRTEAIARARELGLL